MHDAWAPYDTYLDAEHQLCCAHALRELQAVPDTAEPDTRWCWATQASDALVAIHNLIIDAIANGAHTVNPDALDKQVQLYRCAVQIGIASTAARGATNRGLASVDVERLIPQRADSSGKYFRWRFYVDETGELGDGPKLPVRLEAGTTRTWVYGFREIGLYKKTATEAFRMATAPLRAQLIIKLDNGCEARFKPGLRPY